ncbi:DUF6099 family protein [Kitasatospora sp. NPDC059327]|uniref:DUF6099 family protein n=1 Tax=Kitasatospora sp. NPDC059327 TaxID=3346803 RepID=UPI003686388C
MEALRLIKTARHALAEARNVSDVLLEARQAALLTEAVGARLAELDDTELDDTGLDGTGPDGAGPDGAGLDGAELAGLGQQLAEAGAHAAGCLDQSAGDSSALLGLGIGGRAGRLTELGALGPVLEELLGLLQEVGETLVVLACGADTESLYWTCVDGVDAGADCRDVVARLRESVRRAEGGEAAVGGAVGPPRLPAPAAEPGAPLLVLRLGPPGDGGPGHKTPRPGYRTPGPAGAPEVSVPIG